MNINIPIASLNDALDELGMLSTVTQSRKQYIRETDTFICKLTQLNMNGEKAESSKTETSDVPKNLFFKMDSCAGNSSSLNNPFKIVLNDKEKENKTIDGLHILTMNSQFITGFNTGFSFPSFPLNELFEKSRRKIFKCNVLRKRKWRSHPYEKSNCVRVLEHCISDKPDNISELDQAICRLRTTSLSSGTSSSRKIALERHKQEGNNGSLLRSRSMEDLTGLEDSSHPTIVSEKTKDIEIVSIGIQQMQVKDCT